MPSSPGHVKIIHKKDGCQRQLYRFHVWRPLPYLADGSVTGRSVKIFTFAEENYEQMYWAYLIFAEENFG